MVCFEPSAMRSTALVDTLRAESSTRPHSEVQPLHFLWPGQAVTTAETACASPDDELLTFYTYFT